MPVACDPVLYPCFASSAYELAQPCRFMSIPTELRLLIYEHLLRDPVRYIIVDSDLRLAASGLRLFPAILRVCKAIHVEALPVLYRSNTFRMCLFPRNMERILPETYLLPANAALIRRVFTLAHTYDAFDRDAIEKRFRAVGIQWEKLHLWAVRILVPRGYVVHVHIDWLIKPKDADEMKRLGMQASLTTNWSHWLIRKDSLARRYRD